MQNNHGSMHKSMSVVSLQRRQWALCGLAATGSILWPGWAPAQVRVKVAAASNLKFVLADLAALFKQETGIQIDVNLGASGNLARQILQGLPVEQFISADETWVAELVKAGRTQDAGQRYATGQLALIVPKNSALPWQQGLAAVVRALKPGDKLAIANPALAPYGVAAQEALHRSGAAPLASGQTVLGDNVGQATQFVATGAAQAGITALALAHAPEVASAVQFVPLPAKLHEPLHQRMVLLRGASTAAASWHRFLLSPQAQAIFVRHGYGLPQ
jgi:molybdate transport system substrate-binding protein